jgi:dinuclear metal center YbgI/SA1388 family protein
MIKLAELTEYLNNLLQLNQIAGDPSNNGLQIEGTGEVNKILFGVDTSVCLIEKAVEQKADFIFVHHGLSWGSSLKYITNYNASLVKPLFKHDISLYAAHLPLDAHPTAGHNAIIADILRLKDRKMFAKYCDADIGFTGLLPKSLSVNELSKLLNIELSEVISSYSNVPSSSDPHDHCFILDNNRKVKKVGIISGGSGLEGVVSALKEGLDCLITGEFEHQNYHLAKENGLAVIAAGHYKTETLGIFRVMDMIKEKFAVKTEFVDIPTGL